MSQHSRILLIVAVFAVGGVSALAFLADRYAKALEPRREQLERLDLGSYEALDS